MGEKASNKSAAYGSVSACQVCGNAKLVPILSLGHQPIVQNYLDAKAIRGPEATYPLNLVHCGECGLLQLDYIVDPHLVFPPSYPYRTGLTNMLLRNFEELAETMRAAGDYRRGDRIVDIGSNDGSLLASFKRRGMKVLGVEPTDAAKVANRNGIKTYQEFFDGAMAKTIVARHGTAKIVTATNVFAHIPDAPGLMRAVKTLMGADSVFVSESQYLGAIVEKLEFDTVYHEHLRFYSLKPLMRLAEDAGMSVVDAYRISAAGGSIRVSMKRGRHALSPRARKLLAHEKRTGLHDGRAVRAFARSALRAKNDLLALLLKVKKTGAAIAGIGSPARANTLLGFSKITPDLVSYAGEKKGSPKIGLFTPGTHIPVADEAKIFKEQPAYALVLSWHIADELMKLYRTLGYRGAFIMPLPRPRIIRPR